LNDAQRENVTAQVARGLASVRQRIAKACAATERPAGSVAVMAVTKGFGADAVDAALAVGLSDIGENYYQEAQAKFAHVAWPDGAVRRHFIGRLQTNKARRIAALFDVVQSVDAFAAACALDDGARAAGKTLDVLVQVNAAQDARAGVLPAECAEFARTLRGLQNIAVRGVMAVGPADARLSADAFARAARAFDELRRETGADILSLGMTSDLEAAVAAGSTLVRVGTALFGARPLKV
jgi:PLP dependent protein